MQVVREIEFDFSIVYDLVYQQEINLLRNLASGRNHGGLGSQKITPRNTREIQRWSTEGSNNKRNKNALMWPSAAMLLQYPRNNVSAGKY